MCQPKSKGGQRCASHARKKMNAAQARFEKSFAVAKEAQAAVASMNVFDAMQGQARFEALKAKNIEDFDKFERAREVYASTPSGAKDLRARIERLRAEGAAEFGGYSRSGDWQADNIYDLKDALMMGEGIRAANAARARRAREEAAGSQGANSGVIGQVRKVSGGTKPQGARAAQRAQMDQGLDASGRGTVAIGDLRPGDVISHRGKPVVIAEARPSSNPSYRGKQAVRFEGNTGFYFWGPRTPIRIERPSAAQDVAQSA